MSRLRILQVCPRYYPSLGGVEEHVKNISERLARTNELEVLTTDPSGKLPSEETIEGVTVRRFKSWAPHDAYYFSRDLERYLSHNVNNYDIIHAHSYHALPALYVARAKDRNRMVFTPHYHGSGHSWFRNLLHRPYKLLGSTIYTKADRVISVSNYEKSLIMKNFKIDQDKIVVIPNGVNVEEFQDIRRENTGIRTILSVGRLEQYKGMQYLISVLPILDEKVMLEIVGKGPYKDRLIDLAKKEGVNTRVRFSQDLSRKELVQKYVEADMFALLSRYEAFSISVAEALASRLPCIVAKTSALIEWIDNKNCFCVDYPIDLHELANLIRTLDGKKISNADLSSWDEVTRETVEVYRACLL